MGFALPMASAVASSFPAKNMSVATGPGATQLAVIRVPLNSLARILVIVSTAALLAA
eukprot:Gb_39930 [translate_table: standard]